MSHFVFPCFFKDFGQQISSCFVFLFSFPNLTQSLRCSRCLVFGLCCCHYPPFSLLDGRSRYQKKRSQPLRCRIGVSLSTNFHGSSISGEGVKFIMAPPERVWSVKFRMKFCIRVNMFFCSHVTGRFNLLRNGFARIWPGILRETVTIVSCKQFKLIPNV